MAIHYMGLRIETSEDVYEPAEDTFLLAEVLIKEVRPQDIVLDMGTGTGILALLAAKRAKFVIGADISKEAVELAWKNSKINGIDNAIFVVSNLFENLRGQFDLIVFNPPYLPGEDYEIRGDIDKALIGGPQGGEVIVRFFNQVTDFLKPQGRILLVYSSLTKPSPTEVAQKRGFFTKVIAKKKLFFEELYVMIAELSSR
ncbi:class I SAM-dependent methyltransferase [Pyrococcus kukulkanii]|uniref:Class I SAM-dependent methyltransferase n=2 Tax=Pyrococcus kukulkanii TaxID=1609559 RepID=A0ABV4T1P0_9EURY